MGLQSVFTKGVRTVFSVLSDAVHTATLQVNNDDGWGNITPATYSIRVIIDRFTQEDVDYTSFYDLIQPTDTKGLVPGEDITVDLKTDQQVIVGSDTFNIVAWETDPMKAMYTLLLRKT